VNYNKYKRDKNKLSQAILSEIPSQIEVYMATKNLKPEAFSKPVDYEELEEDMNLLGNNQE
jgi:hypothetical protein